MKGKPEAHRLFEEQSFAQNQRTFPVGGEEDEKASQQHEEAAAPKKDHRLNFTIGAFNDGLKTNFCKDEDDNERM